MLTEFLSVLQSESNALVSYSFQVVIADEIRNVKHYSEETRDAALIFELIFLVIYSVDI